MLFASKPAATAAGGGGVDDTDGDGIGGIVRLINSQTTLETCAI